MKPVGAPSAALPQLIEQRRAQDGLLIGNARESFDFAEWLEGVNAGRADAAQRTSESQIGVLL